MLTLKYANVEEALDMVNAQDRGRYFLCTCPECSKREAFIYKNNPNFLQCNRENNCGVSVVFEYEENKKVKEWRSKYESEDGTLTPEQKKELVYISRLFKHIQYNTENESLDNYRGLSRKTTEPFVLDLKSEKIVKNMFRSAPNLFYSKKLYQEKNEKVNYAEMSEMTKRNIVFPIYGDDGLVDRVIMRSTIDPHISKKEVQLQVNPNPKAKDFFKDIPQGSKYVVITEAIIDGMSFREIDPEVGLYSMTGARKWRRVIEDIKAHKNELKDKIFIISTDKDKAGEESRKNIAAALEEEKLTYIHFTPDIENVKDANEYLLRDRNEFIKAYQKAKHGMLIDKEFDLKNQNSDFVINRLYRDQKNDIVSLSITYEGLNIRGLSVDVNEQKINYPNEGLSEERALFFGEKTESILKSISSKAPFNKDFTDIRLKENDNSIQKPINILKYQREGKFTKRIDFQIADLVIKNVEVDSLPNDKDPLIFYPRETETKNKVIAATKEFNNRLLGSIRDYEKSLIKPQERNCNIGRNIER